MADSVAYFLAPNPRFQGRNNTGQPAIGGKLYTYDNQTVDPATTWSDPFGVNPNTNPVILDAKGEANIYWADNKLYSVALYTSDDQLVYTQDYYPTLKNAVIPEDFSQNFNFIRNPQFSFWSNSTVFTNPTSSSNNDYLMDDWIYKNDDSGKTILVQQQTFTMGQVSVPFNPIYYTNYQCTALGVGNQTINFLAQDYQSTQTLSGQSVSFSFWAKSSTASTLQVNAVQNFGTGGSPSADVNVSGFSQILTTAWVQYSGSITFPSVGGKSIGTNLNDFLRIKFDFPLNAIASIDIANVQMTFGSQSFPFLYTTPDDQFKLLNDRITNGIFSTGDTKWTIKTVADNGWVMANNGTIGDQSSGSTYAFLGTKALFILIWNNISVTWCPIFNSDGSPGTKGANAQADYNAHKRLTIPLATGRALSCAGTSSIDYIFTANVGTDEIAIPTTAYYYNGAAVTVTSSATLPAPLMAATTYYVIRIDSTHIQLATSFSDAQNGIQINLTTAGTGVHTISLPQGSWSLGQIDGELTHQQTVGELALHNHQYLAPNVDVLQQTSTAQGYDKASPTEGTEDTGSSTPFNILQPSVFLNVMIKL